tara:strand:- start:1508 stop:2029 length:522 start_codon:yes stop_codon:yes gene_type:complete
MTYRNQHDHTGKCSQNGERAENLFATLIDKIGGTATPSSLAEQFKGIDYHVDLSGRVDVKSRGRTRRGDASPDAKRVWLELKNVQGRKGWVYNEADYIAFEREHRYIVVKRLSLCELIDNLVDMDDYVLSPAECMYNLYSRVGRKDLLTKVHVDDLLTCSHYTLPKPNEDSIN